jgi:hypothetical protein
MAKNPQSSRRSVSKDTALRKQQAEIQKNIRKTLDGLKNSA